jgi:membrane-associated phospholipid phosphatase
MDGSLFHWFNRLANRTGWAHGVLTAYAKYGISLFALLLLATYLDGRRNDDVRAVAGSVWAAGATLIALGIGQLIGGAIDRARPYEAMTGIHLLVDKTTDFSYPSDHATVVGAIAAGLMFTNRRGGRVAAALAVVMAFARVYVGAHYPGDVLAGLALGAAVAAVGRLVAVPQLTRLAVWLSRTAVRRIVTNSGHSTKPV